MERVKSSLRSPVTMAVLLAVFLFALAGWFKPVDDLIRSLRFGAVNHPFSGEIVFVDIDAKSIVDIGVWPWPRSVHARLIERLIADDAAEIVLDIDLSTKSTEAEDDTLEGALRDAGGYVLLASFLQPRDADGSQHVNRPLPRFAKNATLVSVNVPADPDGIARRYQMNYSAEDAVYPSIASALSHVEGAPNEEFTIDFGMDLETIPRYSLHDVLNGSIGAAQLAGRQVIVGASALELRDTFAVPRFGTLPGSLIHLVAAENLRQGITIKQMPIAASVLLALIVSLFIGLILRRGSVVAAAAIACAIAIMVEGGAIVLLSQFAMMLDTFVVHASLIAFGTVSLGYELTSKGSLLDTSTRAHAETRNVLDRVIADNFDGIVVCDTMGNVLMSSRLAELVLGEGNDLVGRQMAEILPETLADLMRRALAASQDQLQGRLSEMEIAVNGAAMIVEFVITVSDPEHVPGTPTIGGRVACLTFRDVTSRRANEERLRYLAGHDPLTGLVTRNRLVDIVNAAMSDPVRRAAGLTVFLLDLSRFKAVNESLGHSYGDAVLQQVARRLKASEVSVVARLGADQFAMIRSGVLSDLGTESFCNAILRRVSDVYPLGEHRAIVGARMGVTTSAVSGLDPGVLLSHADMALSAAKRLPDNSHNVYTPEMEQKIRESQKLEIAMRHAIERNQMHLSYQPQVLLDSGRLIGVEALVRWNHPEFGPIPPGKFIPVAEETGLIIDLGRWILLTACREVAQWQGAIKLAVNVSPLQFEFGDIVGDVMLALTESGLPPERLDIEITESLLISNPRLITQTLETLRGMGIGIAMDDFGTGYSSLSYLGKLPIDKIKIDQSFVRGLPEDEESAAIIRAVMTLAQSLGKQVVAEGIENADQATLLRLAGCQIGQGYFFGKSLRSAEMSARVGRLEQERQRAAG